jgi:ribosomal protein S18 acetylase RimI-like enzyme
MELKFRTAIFSDLDTLITMLYDDDFGKTRESKDSSIYKQAFLEIERDPQTDILVAELDGKIVGMLQLTFMRHLTFQGGLRAEIEGVRTHSLFRGKGIGKRLIEHAVGCAKNKSCRLVQLTSNKNRTDALRFYEKIGFKPTHIGFKLDLV